MLTLIEGIAALPGMRCGGYLPEDVPVVQEKLHGEAAQQLNTERREMHEQHEKQMNRRRRRKGTMGGFVYSQRQQA